MTTYTTGNAKREINIMFPLLALLFSQSAKIIDLKYIKSTHIS